jgi:hypothetical protein
MVTNLAYLCRRQVKTQDFLRHFSRADTNKLISDKSKLHAANYADRTKNNSGQTNSGQPQAGCAAPRFLSPIQAEAALANHLGWRSLQSNEIIGGCQ